MSDAVIFDRLLDDAAVFPPGNAPLPGAVADHLATRGRPRGRFVGSFVCPAGRIEQLARELGSPSPPLDVILVADGQRPLGDAVRLVSADDRLRLRAVESNRADALAQVLPDDVPGVVEVRLDDDLPRRLSELRRAGHGVKLRTGGLVADAFPSEATLARAFVACAATGVAVKLTAGLHSAIRTRDSATGFEHHGFLNALLAVDGALHGGDAGAVEEVLSARDGDRVARAVRDLPLDRAARVRDTLRTIGTCSIAEPLADLVELRLLRPGDIA